MTISSALTALAQDITDARTAIVNKGGTVTVDGGSSQLASDIDTIPTSYIIIDSEEETTLTCGSQTYTLTGSETSHAFNVADGTYTCTASKTGARTNTTTVTVSAEVVNIQLKPLANYTELQYIESTGTQYINTGIVGVNASTFGFESKFMITQAVNGQSFSIAYENWSTSKICFNCGLGQYNGYRLVQDNKAGYGSTSGANVGYQVGNIAEIKLHGTTINYNGTDYTYTRSLSGTTRRSQPIFCTFTGYYQELCCARCYYFKLFDGDTLIFDGVPCIRSTDNVICIYDRVSGEFFENLGTGNFVAGPEVE